MKLRNHEYKTQGNEITLSKEILERWRDHYQEVSERYGEAWRKMFYLGKAEILVDLIKLIDDEV